MERYVEVDGGIGSHRWNSAGLQIIIKVILNAALDLSPGPENVIITN